MRENHRSFALLYPYSIPLYRNLGWEIISNKMNVHHQGHAGAAETQSPWLCAPRSMG